MYVPAAFAEVDPLEIERLVTEYPMAQLVTMTDDGLVATPLPLLYEPSGEGLGSLVGHVARANRQWSKSSSDVEALAIFTGPNAYISPNWYPSKAEHGKVVPTWNYETVHVRGSFVAHDDPVWTRALVTRLTQLHESQFDAPWAVSDAPPDYIDSMVKAIVGIEVQITSIQAKRKLSQNRPPADVAGTIAALQEVGGSSAVVADAMRRLDP
ncbi:MAG TPA: FMN-binding negative transcriptional regulator [Ilumatobacteraceae bacterium]|nr:FMN-binding negative transcriptional regulator [Ilumatobacteraceae bacterium]